jgi:predicted TIM-barrel fold metal-dependent hydrolase
VAVVEAGSDWLEPLLHRIADAHRKLPQGFDEDPVEALKRNVYLSPFFEDDLGRLIGTIGADHVLFGSDYPHPEGLAEPCTYVDHLPAGLPGEDVEKIMGGNLARLMRVPATV